MGRSFLAFGALAAAPLAASGKAFADFESSIARMTAILREAGNSEADIAKLGPLAKQLGRDTVFSSSAAATAMGNFAQAGFKVDEIMSAIRPTLDLASAAQIGVADAANIAKTVMKDMGLEAGDLSSIVDVLARAATTANTDVTMLGAAFGKVGPITKTAGVSLEQITAAIQLLSNAGIQGEEAGTTLRGIILSLTSPSEEARKALAELGVEVNDTRGNFRGFVAIVGDLEKALAGVGTGKRLEKLGTIFPARSAAGAAELIAQGGQKLADATKALGSSGGTAGRIAATQLDTVKGAATLLLSSLELVGAEIGEGLNPLIRKWGAVLTDAANALALVIGRNQRFVAGLAKGVVAVAGAGAALVAVGAAAKLAAFAFGAAGAVLNAVTAAVALTNTAFRLLTVTINLASVATAAFSSLGAVLAAVTSPAALVAAALAGVAYWLTQTESGGQALASLGGLFKELSATAVAAFGGIAEALKSGDIAGAGKILWAALRVEWLTGVDYLKGVWDDWGTAVKEVFAGVSYKLASLMTDAWAGIQSASVNALGSLKENWGGFTKFLMKSWNNFGGFFAKVWEAIKAQFKGGDLEAAFRSIDAATAKKNAAIDNTPRSDERRARAEQLAGIERDRLAAQQALKDQEEAEKEARRKGAAPGPSPALEQAKKELGLALAEAAKARIDAKLGALKSPADEMKARIDAKLGGLSAEKPGGDAETEGLTPDGLDDAMERASAKVDVKGTFQASAARGLSAGDSVREQVDEQKKTNQKLDKIDERLRKAGGPVASEP